MSKSTAVHIQTQEGNTPTVTTEISILNKSKSAALVNLENSSQSSSEITANENRIIAEITANVFEPIRKLTADEKRVKGEIRKVIEANHELIKTAHELFTAQGRRVPVEGQPTWSEWLQKNLPCSKRYVDKILQLSKASGKKYAKTANGYDPYELKSVFQKSIRRGLDASQYWGKEYVLSNNFTALWNVLRVISTEDIGFADPVIAHQVHALFKAWEKTQNEHLIVYAILISQKAKKSRLIDDIFNVAMRKHFLDELEKHPLTVEERTEIREDSSLTIDDVIGRRPPTVTIEESVAALQASILEKDEEAAVLHTLLLDDHGRDGGNVFWKCIFNLSNPATVSLLTVLHANYKDLFTKGDYHKPHRIFMTHAAMLLIRTKQRTDMRFESPTIADAKHTYECHDKVELKPGGEFDFAFDMHTSWGATHGRNKRTIIGMKFFYEVGAHLENAAAISNPYAALALALAIDLIKFRIGLNPTPPTDPHSPASHNTEPPSILARRAESAAAKQAPTPKSRRNKAAA